MKQNADSSKKSIKFNVFSKTNKIKNREDTTPISAVKQKISL